MANSYSFGHNHQVVVDHNAERDRNYQFLTWSQRLLWSELGQRPTFGRRW